MRRTWERAVEGRHQLTRGDSYLTFDGVGATACNEKKTPSNRTVSAVVGTKKPREHLLNKGVAES